MGFARAHAQSFGAPQAPERIRPTTMPSFWPAPRHTFIAPPSMRGGKIAPIHWRTGLHHAALSPPARRGSGNADRDSSATRHARRRETPGRQGGSQRRACAPGLEVSLCQLAALSFQPAWPSNCLKRAFCPRNSRSSWPHSDSSPRNAGATGTTSPRGAGYPHAAGLIPYHAPHLSQSASAFSSHDNLLRRMLRELPHGHSFCPATSSRDYSEQPLKTMV